MSARCYYLRGKAMEKYAGKATIEFEVERYKNIVNGNLVQDIVYPDSQDNYEQTVIGLKVDGSAYFIPGRYNSRYEDCYPDEGDVEIETIFDEEGNDWLFTNNLSHKEKSDIIKAIDKAVREDCEANHTDRIIEF
jgi:hypothetical protein